MSNSRATESKQDSNIPFSALPEKIQEYLIFKGILEKNWDMYTLKKKQETLNEFALQATANSSEQKTAINSATSEATTGEVEIPADVVNIMLKYADCSEQAPGHGSVPLVSTLFNSVKKQKLRTLFTAGLSGNLDEVKAIVDKNPSLLLEKLDEKECMTIQGLSGHKASITFYRTVLATEDTQMAEWLKAKLIEVAGKEEADAQYNAQFPKGWEALEEKRWEPLFKQLDIVTQAIRKAAPGDIVSSGHPEYKLTVKEGSEVAIALAQFRLLLDATLNEIVTTGRHFNPRLFYSALKTYDDHYANYFGNGWSDPRAMLFWQQVIGYIERIMPVNYVQAFFDGLYNSEEKLRKGLPQGRSLRFELFDSGRNTWVPKDFYPLVDSRLGFDFARTASGPRAAPQTARPPSIWAPRFFEAYVNQKQQPYRAYVTPRP